MKESIENFVKTFKENKKRNKKFYNTKDFWDIFYTFNNFKGSEMIEDKLLIMFIESIFENNREIIFYEKWYRYSIAFNHLIIEKYYGETKSYIIHNKNDYLQRLKRQVN